MNISQPISSSLEKVNFQILSSAEIRKLSVKQISNPQTLDPVLLHPVAGGLYDLALGAFTDHNCNTCHLDRNHCPGHCGHIELPLKVFHCVFLDQAYKFLRSQCASCKGFRLPTPVVHLYTCKLRLLRHGLVTAAREIDLVLGASIVDKKRAQEAGEDSDADSDASSVDDDVDGVMAKRESFVRRAIQDAGRLTSRRVSVEESEAISEARKQTIRDFTAIVDKGQKCARCGFISPRFRKNRYVSIYRRSLSAKESAKNATLGLLKPENELVVLNRMKEKQRQAHARAQRGEAMDIDEGIADMDSSDDQQQIRVLEGAPEIQDEEEENSSEEGEPTEAATDDRSTKKRKTKDSGSQVMVDANHIHAALTQLFEKEKAILGQLYGGVANVSADMFFMETLLVPPNKYRKESRTGEDDLAESQDNEAYKAVLNTSDTIWQIRREIQNLDTTSTTRHRTFQHLQQAWLQLQNAVNTLIDKEKSDVRGAAALRVPEGIKQKLEKKEGMFRMNIMGKRVNFAARSVISPDPNIDSNEIGVPPVFAKRLTYPEPVTPHNFDELKQAVINGPDIHPGAVAIEYENGTIVNLGRKSMEERQGIANTMLSTGSASSGARNKKVHRHLVNGDMLIMNRQPTLHKPSMMCHRAKILKGEKTIRMHYANCNTYNADFDGDEMNMHFPQNECARAEANYIANTDRQYLSATAGNPLRGLIQDHISISVWLTNMDTWFTREQYQELLYSAIRPEHEHIQPHRRIVTQDPTICKPKELWSGKQVISTVLDNLQPDRYDGLYVDSVSSTAAKRWGKGSLENEVVVQDNYLCSGILDKKQIGPSTNGLIHTIYEAWGAPEASKFISVLGRLLTRMLNMRAFSCGVEDLILTQEGEKTRRDTLHPAQTEGLLVAAKYVSLTDKVSRADDPELMLRLETVLRDDTKQANLDAAMGAAVAKISSAVTEQCLPAGLIKPFPKNQMQSMTTTGAKGSNVNANLISCNLGQQNLEGRRVPIMISGKSLPSFKPFDSSLRAGGYIADRFLTGIKPQEYFFHAMSGREGLIDTAVKTARSGYLQRCVIKGMEGLRAEYDSSVRDSDGTIIQYLYGEDGLDITSSKNLSHFSFVGNNFFSLWEALDAEKFQDIISEDARDYQKKHSKRFLKSGAVDNEEDEIVLSRFAPATYAGSVSDNFYSNVKRYMSTNPDGLLRKKGQRDPEARDPRIGSISHKQFRTLCDLNYRTAVVAPGEAVGVVAGQSIGEPSTQMTLNTFHLAGHATKNVTLGIPRLREILMTASQNIKTPMMTMYMHSDIAKEQAESFAKGISKLSLAEIIDEVSVEEKLGSGAYGDSRMYKVVIKFYPSAEYREEHAMTIPDVAETMENQFFHHLRKELHRQLKKRGEEKLLKGAMKSDSNPEIGKAVGKVRDEEAVTDAENEGGDSDADDDGDDDATNVKSKANRAEGTTYEDPDDDEMEIERQNEKEASPDLEQVTRDDEDEGYGGSPAGSDDSDEEDMERRVHRKAAKERAQERVARIQLRARMNELTQFDFDDETGNSCSFTLHYPADVGKLLMQVFVQQAAKAALIQSLPGIGSALATTASEEGSEKKELVVNTEGSNMIAMREYSNVVDCDRMFTNDVGEMLRLYGVEAARDTIIRELNGVFSGHGISVDRRHLTLVADYMTRGGGFSPFSRMGMRDKTSPFAKMSFETTFGFLRDAVSEGDVEDLSSPSARITVGRLGRMGTGMCDVLLKLD